VALYNAFSWEPPQFAHVGLLVDARRQKLSKRNQDIGIDAYRRDQVPASALLNFAVLLGWSSGNGPTEVMTLEQMIEQVRLSSLCSVPCALCWVSSVPMY
jgi:glutamyl-tRNA synthetase